MFNSSLYIHTFTPFTRKGRLQQTALVSILTNLTMLKKRVFNILNFFSCMIAGSGCFGYYLFLKRPQLGRLMSYEVFRDQLAYTHVPYIYLIWSLSWHLLSDNTVLILLQIYCTNLPCYLFLLKINYISKRSVISDVTLYGKHYCNMLEVIYEYSANCNTSISWQANTGAAYCYVIFILDLNIC